MILSETAKMLIVLLSPSISNPLSCVVESDSDDSVSVVSLGGGGI